MTTTEIFLVVVAIALVVVGGASCLMIFEQRQTRRLAAPLVSRACPECGDVFGTAILSSAHAIQAFVDPPPGKSLADLGPIPQSINVVCPHCSVCWKFCQGELSKVFHYEKRAA